jgi:hypothetical protein
VTNRGSRAAIRRSMAFRDTGFTRRAALSFDFFGNQRHRGARPAQKTLLDATHCNGFASRGKPSSRWGSSAMPLNQARRLGGEAVVG